MSEHGDLDREDLPVDPEKEASLWDTYRAAAREILEKNGRLIGKTDEQQDRQINFLAFVLENSPSSTIIEVSNGGTEVILEREPSSGEE